MASREKTKEVYETADKLGLSWPLDDNVTTAELEEILFPDKYKSGCRYVEPDYAYIRRELAKPGVTIWRCCGRSTAGSATRPGKRHT